MLKSPFIVQSLHNSFSDIFLVTYQYLQQVLSRREYVDERTIFQYTNGINEEWLEKYNTARKVEIKVFARNAIKINGTYAELYHAQ